MVHIKNNIIQEAEIYTCAWTEKGNKNIYGISCSVSAPRGLFESIKSVYSREKFSPTEYNL